MPFLEELCKGQCHNLKRLSQASCETGAKVTLIVTKIMTTTAVPRDLPIDLVARAVTLASANLLNNETCQEERILCVIEPIAQNFN
jgi:hypothetical protein